MRRRGGAGLGLTLLLWGGAAWGATYYSAPSGSGTACSLEAPCSLGTGTSTLRPGDTLYLRGGTYNDGINPTTGALASGGGESSRTTIAAYPGETPELTRITLGEGGGFSWMTFRQLRVAGEVFLGPDTHHIRLEQSDIVNPPSMGISGGGGYHEFLGNTVHGAYWYGTYWAGHDSLFDGNSFYDNGGYGVHLYSATTNTVDITSFATTRSITTACAPMARAAVGWWCRTVAIISWTTTSSRTISQAWRWITNAMGAR